MHAFVSYVKFQRARQLDASHLQAHNVAMLCEVAGVVSGIGDAGN